MTSTLPNGAFVSAETVAGPVGALVIESAQLVLSAPAAELKRRAPAATHSVSTPTTAAAPSGRRKR
jgi:hypothetical protein